MSNYEDEEYYGHKYYRENEKRLKLYKVWKRPVFLQYSYLYDYRYNYYDDVIDYLDRRQRGIYRDLPRAQTWPERVLRIYTDKLRRTESNRKKEKDLILLANIRACIQFYTYHLCNLPFKYSSIML